MENLLFFLATSFVLRLSTSRKFKNYFIGDTGCSALLFANEEEFERSVTASGDALYFHEFAERTVSYGIICIQLKESSSLKEATEMLVTYLNKLRTPFGVLHHAGIQRDTDWNSSQSKTMMDYWQDGYGRDWKVKGYTNGRVLAVLYVKDIANVEVTKHDLFLDSFHFGTK